MDGIHTKTKRFGIDEREVTVLRCPPPKKKFLFDSRSALQAHLRQFDLVETKYIAVVWWIVFSHPASRKRRFRKNM